MKAKNSFIRLLKDNDALHEWLYEIFHNPDIFYDIDNIDDVLNANLNAYIDCFDWSRSKQGHEFWHTINEKWKKKWIYKNLEKN